MLLSIGITELCVCEMAWSWCGLLWYREVWPALSLVLRYKARTTKIVKIKDTENQYPVLSSYFLWYGN